MSKLYSFGCSFSWNIAIEYDQSYPVLVSKHLNLELQHLAAPALCNDEIFSRFISNLDKYQEGDLITYQFTYPARKGFFVENSHYESSAGFFSDTAKDNNGRLRTNVFANQKVVDYLFANVEFCSMFLYFTVQRVVTVLDYLKQSRGVNYKILFINEEFAELVYKMNSNYRNLRVDGKDMYEVKDRFFIKFLDNVITMDNTTIGISEYIEANNLTVDQYDKHPGVAGHRFLADRIISTLH